MDAPSKVAVVGGDVDLEREPYEITFVVGVVAETELPAVDLPERSWTLARWGSASSRYVDIPGVGFMDLDRRLASRVLD